MRSPFEKTRRNHMTTKELDKYDDEIQKHSYPCTCGRKVMIRFDETKSLCTWCGKYVYKNKKDEFIDRMKGKVNGKI